MEPKVRQTRIGSSILGKVFVNRHFRSSAVPRCFSAKGTGRVALLLLMTTALALCAMAPGFAQLADSPWPMRGHDIEHTGQSPYQGPWGADLQWKFGTGDSLNSSPAIGSDGTVYVGSLDGNLYAINPDGNLQWKFETGDPLYSSPAISSDGTIYVGSDDNNLYAINPDGNLKWDFKAEGDVDSSPTIDLDGTVYVGTWDNHLYAINPDGSLKWKFETGDDVRSSPAIGSDGTIYIGSDDNNLYAINPDGSLKWKFDTGGDVDSSPAIDSDGTIYIGSDDNNFYAINPDGSLKWKFGTGGDVDSSPAIDSNGTVYVGSDDNNIYAFRRRMSNSPPLLQAGRVLPETGHEETEFVFNVTYSDADNDSPSHVTVKIDRQIPKAMSRHQSDDHFTRGVVYEYRTKLSAGEHSFSFAASDGPADATGDILFHSGPTVLENRPPILSNGTIWPGTGTKSTNFRFTVIYLDEDNDPPSEVAVYIDDNPPQSMYAVSAADTDYTDGTVYEYRAKLDLGDHVCSFAAKDWSMDATGDIDIHVGPVVTLSDAPPVLYNGMVMPQMDITSAEFTFMVTYTHPNDEPPSEVALKIDEDTVSMVAADPDNTDYVSGVTYHHKAKLHAGEHTYAFAAKSAGGADAVGDVASHLGPIVVENLGSFPPLPGHWTGVTSQGKTVSFEVSEDAKYITDFKIKVDEKRTYWGPKDVHEETYWENGVLVTRRVVEYGVVTSINTISKTMPRGEIAGGEFRMSGSVSGLFTSASSAEGEFDISSEEGTWTASRELMSRPLIAIDVPKDNALVTGPFIEVSGTAAGPLVASAKVNDVSVDLADGSFSANVALEEGSNTIELIALDANENIVGTYSIRVVMDSVAPEVIITQPQNGLEIGNSKIMVKGIVDDPYILYVDINGIPVCVADGEFTTTLFLAAGINNISANAADRIGNLGSAEISVTFDPAALWDVDQSGTVDISDLILIADAFGTSGQDLPADVNGDGVVDIADLMIVAMHFEENTNMGISAAPGISNLPAEMIEGWLKEARASDDGSEAFRQGIAVLERLLRRVSPKKTAMLRNYPNPFNPDTWIPYQLSEESDVSIAIYDVAGRIVRHLDMGSQPAGIYQTKDRAAHWNGRNEVGESVASGIYFVVFRARGYQKTSRIVLLR